MTNHEMVRYEVILTETVIRTKRVILDIPQDMQVSELTEELMELMEMKEWEDDDISEDLEWIQDESGFYSSLDVDLQVDPDRRTNADGRTVFTVLMARD